MKSQIISLRRVLPLLLLLAATVFSTSCDSDLWDTDERLTGVWSSTSYDGYYMTRLELYGDGTGVLRQYDGSYVSDYARFTWDCTRHSLTLYYYDRPTEYWSMDFDGRNTFRLYSGDGTYYLFSRDY